MISPETLRKYPAFAGLDPEFLKEIAALSEEHQFKAGDSIFEESGSFVGEAKLYDKAGRATHLMLIIKGEVHLTYEVGLDEPVIIGTLVEGDLLGVSALIPPYFLTTSAVAKNDGALIAIEAEELRALIDEKPQYGCQIYRRLSEAVMSRLKDTRVELAATLA